MFNGPRLGFPEMDSSTVHIENLANRLMPASNQSHTLIANISRVVARYSARPAVWACGETLTYGEFWHEAGRMARALLQAGVLPGDRVAILSARSLTAYTAILAALRAGCTYVPLNPRFPLARNRAILSASEAVALIIDRKSATQFSQLLDERPSALKLVVCPEPQTSFPSGGLTVVDQTDFERDDNNFVWPVPNPDDLAYLLFTSGSTGAPKGVPIRNYSVCDYIGSLSALSPVTPDDRLIQLVDLTFDLSAHDMFLSWSNGASIVSVPENAILVAPRYVQSHEVTGWLSVPSAVGLAHQAGLLEPGALPSVRFSHFCGEALPRSVAEIWSQAAPNSKIYNLYGPTEATIAFSYYRYTPGETGPTAVPIGWALEGQHMAIFDESGQRVSPGELGEIHLAGSQLSPGYWRAPHLDAERFVMLEGRRWYRTGDVGRLEADGYHYLGRVDRQTKIRGYRVELLEIEGALRSATGREVVAAVPWPILGSGVAQGVVGFVTGGAVNADEARAKIGEALPEYMVPSCILHIDDMPLNANGKVDYKALEEYLNGQAPQPDAAPDPDAAIPVATTAPSKAFGDKLQELIAGWASLFPNKQISPESSFSALEGDSLTYVTALIETERVLGSIPDQWTSLSLRELAHMGGAKQPSLMTDLDTASLMRCAAILLVVAAHLSLFEGAGETSALILISGFFFGRLQLDEFHRNYSIGPLLRFVSRVLLPCYAVFIVTLPVTWKHQFPVGLTLDAFLLHDIAPKSWTGGNVSYLWYIHALIHIALFFTGMAALAVFLKRKKSTIQLNVEAMLLIALGIGFVFRFLIPAALDSSFFAERLDDDALPRYLFLGQLFTFSVGAAIGGRSSQMRQVGLILAVADAALTWIPYDASESGAIMLSAFVLAFVPKVRSLQLLQSPIYTIANASLFIYLTHMPVKAVMQKLGFPLWSMFIPAIVVGVVAWHIWTIVQQKLASRPASGGSGAAAEGV